MTYFYKFCKTWIEFDLVIARSTGRNPDNVRQLQSELESYELLILKREINV